MKLLAIRTRQRVRRVNTPLLRRLTRHVLGAHLHAGRFQLCLHLVDAPEMARLNQQFLRHQGSTDVITFDHSQFEPERLQAAPELHGEIYLSLPDAVAHAKTFRTTWQVELTRCIVHGLLHLCGYDDQKPAARRRMKRTENRLVRLLAAEFALAGLAMGQAPGRHRRPQRSAA